MEKQKYMKLADVAQKFGVTNQTVRNWISKGLLNAIMVDNCNYVTVESVKAIEENHIDVVKESIAVDDYLNSLQELSAKYRKSAEEYRESIVANKALVTNRVKIARFVPIIYELLQDDLPIIKRCHLIIQRVIEGEDSMSISQELGVSPERVRQILEREMRRISVNAVKYHRLIKENEELKKENATLKLNLKNMKSVVADCTTENVVVESDAESVPDSILTKRLIDCNLSVRALNCLHSYYGYNGDKWGNFPIETIGDLARHLKTDLLKQRNFGKKTLKELDDFLKEHGLEWGKRYMAKPDGSIVEISSTN